MDYKKLPCYLADGLQEDTSRTLKFIILMLGCAGIKIMYNISLSIQPIGPYSLGGTIKGMNSIRITTGTAEL